MGKTTVGQELERITALRLFHLHQVADLVGRYFPYSPSATSSYHRLVVGYRRQFFEEAAASGMGVITTTGWWFDRREEDDSIRGYIQPFLDQGGQVYLVELVASLETRLARNLTENRRNLKRVDWSTEEYLREYEKQHPYRSDGVPPFDAPRFAYRPSSSVPKPLWSASFNRLSFIGCKRTCPMLEPKRWMPGVVAHANNQACQGAVTMSGLRVQ